jgi:uncharacterized protein YbjQ (UPF0145 family)
MLSTDWNKPRGSPDTKKWPNTLLTGYSKRRLFLKSNKKFHMIDNSMITTSISLEGFQISKNLGVVRGITVRSRSLLGNMAGGLQTIFGGKISIYVNLCERTREEAFQHMIQHAEEIGANAIINMRYDANEVMNGVTEVLAYGTAVRVERK